ncbi:MAG TPA: PRC-barrel domain-containing protein [Opitutaceae bacterium]
MTTPATAFLFLLVLSAATGAPPPTADTAGAASPPVRHTTEATMDQHVTANDLIGRDVYDRQNNALGEIVDIALGGVVPQELKNALAKSDRDGYSASGVAPAPGDDTGRQQQEQRNDGGEATDRERDDQPGDERVQAFATSTVFISVGGVFGMGADLVRAPLSALGYDRRHNRIVLDLGSEELRSLLKTAKAPARRTSRAAVIIYGMGR